MTVALAAARGAYDRAETFDLHVDSAAGNDSTGTGTKALPYATVAKALTVYTAGQGIGVKAGSVLRPAAALAPTLRVRLGMYGVGAKPIISGGTLVTGWTQQLSSPFVQRFVSNGTGTGTSLSVPIAANTTQGNTVILAVKLGGGIALNSVTDSKGNTWTIDKKSANVSGGTAAIAHATLTTALTTSDTLTVTPASSTSAAVAGYEYTPFSASSPDQNATANGTGTSAAIGPTLATAQAAEIALSVVVSGSSLVGYTSPAGWTDRPSGQTANAVEMAELVLNATGTQTSTWTIPSVTWAGVIQTYKLPSATTTNIYAATLASTPAFVSSTTGGVTTGLALGSSATALTSGQWFYSGGTLYVNLGGTNPGTVTIEAATRQIIDSSARIDGSVFRKIDFRYGYDRGVHLPNTTRFVFDQVAIRYFGFIANSGAISVNAGGAGSARVTRTIFDALMNDAYWHTSTGGVEIDHNTITRVGYLAGDVQSDGIQVLCTTTDGGVYIHDNTVDMTGTSSPKACINLTAPSPVTLPVTGIVENNTAAGAATGIGQDNVSNLIWRRNSATNDAGSAYAVFDSCDSLTAHHNLGHDAHSGFTGYPSSAITNLVHVNCTYVNMSLRGMDFQGSVAGSILNTIIWCPARTGACLVVATGSPTIANCIIGPENGTALIIWHGTTYTTLAAFQSATGNGVGCSVGDPLLDASFKPGNGSPALNAGQVVAGITDGYLGAAPDIGYVEVS